MVSQLRPSPDLTVVPRALVGEVVPARGSAADKHDDFVVRIARYVA